jgi:hypothetical protein
LNFPSATVLVAMSRRKGRLRRPGAAKAMGLVPKRASRPKVGTMDALNTAVVETPMRPWPAALSA